MWCVKNDEQIYGKSRGRAEMKNLSSDVNMLMTNDVTKNDVTENI